MVITLIHYCTIFSQPSASCWIQGECSWVCPAPTSPSRHPSKDGVGRSGCLCLPDGIALPYCSYTDRSAGCSVSCDSSFVFQPGLCTPTPHHSSSSPSLPCYRDPLPRAPLASAITLTWANPTYGFRSSNFPPPINQSSFLGHCCSVWIIL